MMQKVYRVELSKEDRDVLKDLLSMKESRIDSLLSDGIIDEPR